MNIKRAKKEIKNTIQAYLAKNEQGEYKIPEVRQRPILLIGPPGIGKTAIMEQIASECGILLAGYSITHHTRQSAIGLPKIEIKEFMGKTYSVTEYTMSEIIASVYDKINQTGVSEGILFLDEINCVSETLAPAILQFLQCKTFGTHKLPSGWIIIAAGNPPEYNNSVREFDIVTLDRVKKIEVFAEFAVWKEYAYRNFVHSAILNYLELKKENFYRVETTVEGKQFATARGWEDLSVMLIAYEELGLAADEEFICQYIQHPVIAKDFANYLDLFHKYEGYYNVEAILLGSADLELKDALRRAPFDEAYSVIGLILGKLNECFLQVYEQDITITSLHKILQAVKAVIGGKSSMGQILSDIIARRQGELTAHKAASMIGKPEERAEKRVLHYLSRYQKNINNETYLNCMESFEKIKTLFQLDLAERTKQIEKTEKYLDSAFCFLEEVFGESQEMVIFITELTMNFYAASFISEYGCEKFYQYNRNLLFEERQKKILKEVEEIRRKGLLL